MPACQPLLSQLNEPNRPQLTQHQENPQPLQNIKQRFHLNLRKIHLTTQPRHQQEQNQRDKKEQIPTSYKGETSQQ